MLGFVNFDLGGYLLQNGIAGLIIDLLSGNRIKTAINKRKVGPRP